MESRRKKRILFLADRNILVDQTRVNDFKPFAGKMTKIEGRKVHKSYEIYLSLYQAVSGNEEERNIYKQFSPDFFDLIIVDECHRGSAAEHSAWREILTYFSAATQIGLTATPRETGEISNMDYFGEPIFTYSLKQGIADGFLAPNKVIRIDLDNHFKDRMLADGDQPPVGIQLCSDKDHTKVQFATAGMSNKLFVSRYLTLLPSAEQLQRFVETDRARVEAAMEQQARASAKPAAAKRKRKKAKPARRR